MEDIDAAYQRFLTIEEELRSALKGERNESDTRFAVLDRLLLEVLGWKHDQIQTEPATTAGFIDYKLLLSKGRAGVIVEAKRSGRLALKSASKTKSVLSLGGPVLQPTYAAVDQARTYAIDEGAPAAVATDGNCWVFFRPARTDGRPFKESRAIVFPSLDAVKAEFVIFFELLSFRAVGARLNVVHLNSADGMTVSSMEQQYHVSDPREGNLVTRDALAVDAALLFQQFFSKMTSDDPEMMNQCFVETSESKKADLEIQKIAEKLVNSVTGINTRDGMALQQQIERTITTQQSEIVLLVGNKGSGKTTFTTRFFDQILPESISSQCVVVRLNVEQFTGEDNILRLILIAVRDGLESAIFEKDHPDFDEIQGTFWREYGRRRDGPYRDLYETNKPEFKSQFGAWVDNLRESDPETYVKHLLNRAVHSNKQLPCLIFDNTDNFPYPIQDKIYQMAHALGTSATTFTLVPITDRTIWQLSKAGALQSYSPTTFYLPVPEAKEIISKRVSFLKGKLSSSDKGTYFSRKGFKIDLQDVSLISDAIERVFVEADYVSGIIGQLGNYDIRRMLEVAKRVFMSPEIKIDDIMKSKFGGESITADSRRTHRALIKGEYDRFSEDENVFVTNLFRTSTQLPPSPLLAYYILYALRNRYNAARESNTDQRHWRVAEVSSYFEACGVTPEITLRVLQRLLDRRLVEELDPNTELLDMGCRVGIKESGAAHLDLALNSSVYVEQMALTTGINDVEVRDKIKSMLPTASGQTFIDARDVFINFVLKLDAIRMTIPGNPDYAQLIEARNYFRAIKISERPQSNMESADRDTRLRPGKFHKPVHKGKHGGRIQRGTKRSR